MTDFKYSDEKSSLKYTSGVSSISQQTKVFDKVFNSRRELKDFFSLKIKSENSEFFNTIVKTENYYDDRIGGGATYLILKQEDYKKFREVNTGNPYKQINGGICIGKGCSIRKESFIDIPITSVGGKFVNAVLISNGVFRSSQIGCLVNGHSDNSEMINAAISYAHHSKITGKIVLEPSNRPITIKSSIKLRSNLTIIGENWLKVIGNDLGPKDAGIVIEDAFNITLRDLKIDCNNVPAQCGLNINFKSGNILIDNIHIKNAKHLKKTNNTKEGSYGGGRAIIIEAGNYNLVRDNQGNFISAKDLKYKNCIINNIIIENCYMGLGLAGGIAENYENNDSKDDCLYGISNCIINNVVVNNSEIIIGLFGNIGGEHYSGDRMQYMISNISGRNCGKRWNTQTNSFENTYGGNQLNAGLISSDRGSNVMISNVSIVNDKRIGEIFSPIVGDFFNVKIKNFSFEGNCKRLAFFQEYTEKDLIKKDRFITKLSDFEINHIGKYSEGILKISKPNKVQSSKLKIHEYNPFEQEKIGDCVILDNCKFLKSNFNEHLKKSGVSVNLMSKNFDSLKTVYCEFFNRVLNIQVKGMANNISSNFNWSDQKYNSVLFFEKKD